MKNKTNVYSGGGVNPIFALALMLMLLFNVVGYAQTITCVTAAGALCPPPGSDYLPGAIYQFKLTTIPTNRAVTWLVDKVGEYSLSTIGNNAVITWNRTVARGNGKFSPPSPLQTITAISKDDNGTPITKILTISLCTFNATNVTFANNTTVSDDQELPLDFGFSGTVSLSALGSGFSKPGLTFTWSAPPGWTFPSGNTGTSTTTNVTPCSEGDLKFTVTGCNGVQQTITIRVVRAKLQKPAPLLTTDLIICQGNTTTVAFTDATTNRAANVTRYEWEAVGGIKILQNGNQVSTATTTQPTITVIGVGNSIINGVGI